MPLEIPNYQQYYTDANTSLEAYYQRLLTEEQGDVERVKRRLQEDYERGMRITMEDYEFQVGKAVQDWQAGVNQEKLLNPMEQRAQEDDQLRRGISLGGVAEQQQGELKTRQDLRREAIDRALMNTEKEQSYAKERSLEAGALTKTRGTEDVLSDWSKFQNMTQQEREEKAAQLAEQAYQRDLQKKQAEEQSDLAEKQLKLQEEALGQA